MARLLSALNVLLLGTALAAGAYWFVRNVEPESVQQRRSTAHSRSAQPTHRGAEHSERRLGDGPTAPRTRPGAPLVIDLVEDANSHYGKARWTEADVTYAQLSRAVTGVTYDPLLGHAARELAAFYALERQMAPSGGLQFILDSAGAAEWDVLRTMLVTSDTGLDSLQSRLERLVEEAGEPIKVGIGESYPASPPLRRYIAVLISTSPLTLNPVPRRAKVSEQVTLSGRLSAGLRKLRAVVLRPDGSWDSLDAVRGPDRSFVVTVTTGDEAGMLSVELIADRATGPHPLAQLEIAVEVPLGTRFEGRWPPDESDITTRADAERLALELLNADRQRGGLAALRRAPALDAIAGGHSADMRDSGFTGHTSPRTGTLGDRLKRAGYSAVFRAENIATNQNLHDAQAGLVASLAHRRNILSKEATAVGIGVAIRESGDKRIYYLTQVFAKPVERIDPAEALFEVKKRLSAARKRQGLSSLRWDAELALVARTVARGHAPSPGRALEAAKELARRGAAASVSTLGELGGLVVPKLAVDRRYRRLGVGIHQRASEPGEVPTIIVVIIAAG